MNPKKITLERSWRASLDDAWMLWTTKDGLESWWGPDGFQVEVHSIDLKPGGELRYRMFATGAPQIAFMQKAGRPISSEHSMRYTEVTAKTRLSYEHLVDFVPEVAHYTVNHLVELAQHGPEVKLTVTVDTMHDAMWTQRMKDGWEMELAKLERRLTR